MPDKINVTMTGIKISVGLHLSRVIHTDNQPLVYTVSVDNSGQLVHTREVVGSLQTTAYYQDIDHNAIILVVCQNETLQDQHLKFSGLFSFEGVQYTLKSLAVLESHPTSSRDHYVIQHENESKDFQIRSLRKNVLAGGPSRFRRQGQQSGQPSNSPSDEPLYALNGGGDNNQTLSNYYIDIVAVVDYKAYTRFYQQTGDRSLAIGSIKEYYGFIMSGVDMLYRNTKFQDFKLHVRLIKVVVAETADSSNFTEQFQMPDAPYHTVDSNLALGALKDYVNGPGHAVVTPSDHVMLFTGYDLSTNVLGSVEKAVAGLAYMAKVCLSDGRSSSIIEDIKGFNCLYTAAHELGHSLSAKHDGIENECKDTDQFIMTAVDQNTRPSTELNPWRFSNCSQQEIATYIRKLLKTSNGEKCLKEKIPAEDDTFLSNQTLPGLKYSADDQCKMIYGNNSFLCLGISSHNLIVDPTRICTAMYCYHPMKNTCYHGLPVQGTICGNQKVCLFGECVPHPSAPTLNEKCMFGDNRRKIINGMNCSQAVLNFPHFCYDNDTAASCCESCQSVSRPGQEKCMFGDNRFFRINGMNCSQAVSNFPHFCYNNYTAAFCCESCQAVYRPVQAKSVDTVSSVRPGSTEPATKMPELGGNTFIDMPSSEENIQFTLSSKAIFSTTPDAKEASTVSGNEGTSIDYNVLTTIAGDSNGFLSTNAETTSVAVDIAEKMLTSMTYHTESMATISSTFKTTGNPLGTDTVNTAGTPTVNLQGVNANLNGSITVRPIEPTTVNPLESNLNTYGVKTVNLLSTTNPIVTESKINKENLSAVKNSTLDNLLLRTTTNSSTSMKGNNPTSDAKTIKPALPSPSTATLSSNTSCNINNEQIETNDAEQGSKPTAPATKSQSPHLQLQQYVSRQQQQLQQHMLQQQSLLERLLQHNLLHQENTLLHHQPHLKQLLQHYLRHQRHLIEHYLSQQKASLQEHLRNYEILQNLCTY